MDIGIEGIKCDNPACDYEDMNIQWGSTPEDILATNDAYLNKPCPKCGTSLLTPEDHASVKLMILLMPEMNALEEELKEIYGEDHPINEEVNCKVHMDGTGKLKFDI